MESGRSHNQRHQAFETEYGGAKVLDENAKDNLEQSPDDNNFNTPQTPMNPLFIE